MIKLLTSNWGKLAVIAASAVVAKLTGSVEALALMPIFATVDSVAGHPDYTQDGTNKNIPWAFSRKTVAKFYDSAVVSQITNTDYEGEINSMGDKVVINTIPDINITKYQKGSTTNWQDAESPAVEMTMDRAIQYAFKMDKVDIKQFNDKSWMDKLAADAASQQKVYIDEEFLLDIGGTSASNGDASTDNKGATAGLKSSSYNMGAAGAGIALTKTNIMDKIIECSGVADEQNWPEDGRWLVIPTLFTVLLKQSDIKDASLTGDGQSTLRSGRIGMIDRWTIYATNLYTGITDGANTAYTCLFGTNHAVAFATQLVETEYFEKLETTFGRGMKGLQVYDWKTIKSESLGSLYAYKG